MSDDLFNTPAEEVHRLVAELHETKEALRELSGKLTRIETRLKRVFPRSFPKKADKVIKERTATAVQEPPTLTPEEARTLYENLVESARKGQIEEVRRRLSSLNLPDLSFLRRELGASLGKRKASPRVLIDTILGRVKESVMLSRHTNREELLREEQVFENGDRVRKKQGSQEVLTIVETREPGDLYKIQLGNDAASGEYVKGSEIEIVEKAKKSDRGRGFVPTRSIVD